MTCCYSHCSYLTCAYYFLFSFNILPQKPSSHWELCILLAKMLSIFENSVFYLNLSRENQKQDMQPMRTQTKEYLCFGFFYKQGHLFDLEHSSARFYSNSVQSLQAIFPLYVFFFFTNSNYSSHISNSLFFLYLYFFHNKQLENPQ